MKKVTADTFPEWRTQARQLLGAQIPPEFVYWGGDQAALFDLPEPVLHQEPIKVPRSFFDFAEAIACHRDPERWALLYQALWRITHGEKHLFDLQTDPLVHRLSMMNKAVRRDAHKAKAFVRFRETQDEFGTHFIAWHRPDHKILPLVAPFFGRRFAVMRWAILTPDQSVHWDGEKLQYGTGVPQSEAPDEDGLEDLWRSYYRATFNPARIKLDMMRREMPVRHWATLPETNIIPEMLAEAEERIAEMVKHTEGFAESAADYLPDAHDLSSLRQASKNCKGCPLYKDATQTIFGEGPARARYMLVGEQPGDQEDLQGHAFVGPAGQMLDRALDEADIERGDVYITNAVKHFKFELQPNGRRRHVTPKVREIKACKPWLDHEIQAIKPKAIAALGATAAKSLIGPGFTLKEGREKWHEGPEGSKILATYHPSAILRAPDHEQREAYYHALVKDLKRLKTA